ncbi:PAS domain-containing protein [Maritimibacter sp. DP1N21-5]|uniref:PAS domain-containing protein n=1 Tax=Maritimibacter sp. DP1N21-5 TaxID=2836867 RepID=UPI001C474AC7|nr:PAS domain-containing protein [Maritimibacter sp. DP1N21-5]MBV7410980.1 PAS domain-containing protein [Maritimibacter sp. DP1N21-5]
MTLILAVGIVLTAFMIAFSALMLAGWLRERLPSKLSLASDAEADAIVFLFRNERLLDASPSARAFIGRDPGWGSDWLRLETRLSRDFPDLKRWFSDLASAGEKDRLSEDGATMLHARWREGLARISLLPVEPEAAVQGPDRHAYAALEQEVDGLRRVADHAPLPIWREAADGTVEWCNLAYLDMVERLAQDARPSWPPARLFDLAPAMDGGAPATTRHSVAFPDRETRNWFDVDVVADLSGQLCVARPIDDLVRAERSQSEFVVTMSKTFASLPIGLAIFNRSRGLTMFNPALLDLTGIRPDFLVTHPTVGAFFDRLREMKVMPEPKDYREWRQRISDLTTQAEDGTFEETWTLPHGETYRVTGHPHPDGAIAFLFEDISDEITVERRFRTDMETVRAVLDVMTSAIVVLSDSGNILLANEAHRALWAEDRSETEQPGDISQLVRTWQDACAPSALWSDLESFVLHQASRDPWSAPVARLDGRRLGLNAIPLLRGATMVEFVPLFTGEGRMTELSELDELPAIAAQ